MAGGFNGILPKVGVLLGFGIKPIAGILDSRLRGNDESCVLRQHPLFADSAAPPNCSDPELFANVGLPKNPDKLVFTPALLASANPSPVRITILRASAADQLAVSPEDRYSFNNDRVPPFLFDSGGGGESKKGEFAIAAGTAAFVGLLVWNYWDGNPGAFSFAPHTSFSHNGGTAAYSYGSRLDFRQDDLSAYWGASQSHAGGETDGWLYFTGIEYGKDFWNISYNSESQGVRTNMDLAAGAEWQRGILLYKTGVATVYNIAEAGEDFTASWRNSLELDYQGWKITPSANLYWRENSAATGLRLNAKYRF